jgi:hypothetical protein
VDRRLTVTHEEAFDQAHDEAYAKYKRAEQGAWDAYMKSWLALSAAYEKVRQWDAYVKATRTGEST